MWRQPRFVARVDVLDFEMAAIGDDIDPLDAEDRARRFGRLFQQARIDDPVAIVSGDVRHAGFYRPGTCTGIPSQFSHGLLDSGTRQRRAVRGHAPASKGAPDPLWLPITLGTVSRSKRQVCRTRFPGDSELWHAPPAD
jgi:hypothetical protein